MRRALLLSLAAVLAAAGTPARAAPVATVTAAYFDYYPGGTRTPEFELHIEQGSMLVFANLDPIGGPHTVTDAIGQPPAFDSDPIDPPRATPVHGVETLAPGAYPFTCTVHAYLMTGTLHVDPA